MKTNHRRGFRAKNLKTRGLWSGVKVDALSDTSVGASTAGDFSNGHRGEAKAKSGGKKFLRSRVRFRQNSTTQRLAKEPADE